MSNERGDNEMQLSKYGEYLLRNQLVSERHAPFFVKWVRRFLSETWVDPAQSPGERLMLFVERLGALGAYEEWQVEQAEKAIRLYFHNFLN